MAKKWRVVLWNDLQAGSRSLRRYLKTKAEAVTASADKMMIILQYLKKDFRAPNCNDLVGDLQFFVPFFLIDYL